MKTKSFVYILMMVFFTISCQQDLLPDEELSAEAQTKSAITIPDGLTEGTVITTQFYSPSLEGNLVGDPALRNVNIYLPKSYFLCPEKRFPVIYFLHGMPAWEKMLMEPASFEIFQQISGLAPVDFPAEGFTQWLNQLIDEGGMKETIIVMPNAQTIFGPSLYLNSEVLGNYEDYIVNELTAFIDHNLRTIPHFNWRAISGHCAGGYGALNIGMRHPKLFRYVGALSPAHFSEAHFNQIALYSAYEEMVWQQQGAPAGPLPYSPFEPAKFMTNTVYLLCQFWLPNPQNPPYYCDLPYTYIDGQPEIIPELMARIDQQNLLAETKQFQKELRQLKTVYFDCGSNDELFMFPFNQMLDAQLTEMHIKHQFEAFEGTHINHLYERLAKAWIKLSNDFPDYEDE
ncbi:alpha/beta hydrolase [Mangrovibacterium lignilyticum]|uniref:alpha/beta hydrolase n=1 Tax=Mangrovibacterium lignilyticum TaxID=2668052 RepID=UPI0013D42BA9|nr:alpha/beta hydrolase-fold protein [Mangrovibacterium lignilyticum]